MSQGQLDLKTFLIVSSVNALKISTSSNSCGLDIKGQL